MGFDRVMGPTFPTSGACICRVSSYSRKVSTAGRPWKGEYMRSVVFVAFAIASAAHGQVFSVLHEQPNQVAGWAVPGPRPTSGTIVGVDAAALAARLAKAPQQRFDAQLTDYGVTISLPDPRG